VVRSGLDAVERTFYLRPDGESFLMDWEATTGHWPIPFKTFKALGTRRHLRVRVIAELSDYFNYGFLRGEVVSVQLQDISNGRIHGYIPPRHEDFQALVNYLSDGRSHRIMLDILPAKATTDVVNIIKFVSDSWVMPVPQAQGQ
jgi:hypothetical protein